MAVTKEEIEQQALFLAQDNRQADPDIIEVLWFPHDSEVRLVELHLTVPSAEDRTVIRPYYFRASPEDHLPAPSGIAMIRPEDKGKLELPADWEVTWDDARKIA
jgi:hypothetical protein